MPEPAPELPRAAPPASTPRRRPPLYADFLPAKPLAPRKPRIPPGVLEFVIMLSPLAGVLAALAILAPR